MGVAPNGATAATATAQTNAVDQLASLFAITPDTLRVCADGAATATIFSDVLNSTLTATRACFDLELTRERLDECIDKVEPNAFMSSLAAYNEKNEPTGGLTDDIDVKMICQLLLVFELLIIILGTR